MFFTECLQNNRLEGSAAPDRSSRNCHGRVRAPSFGIRHSVYRCGHSRRRCASPKLYGSKNSNLVPIAMNHKSTSSIGRRSSRRLRSRGAVMVEFIVVLMPLLTAFFCGIQIAFLGAAKWWRNMLSPWGCVRLRCMQSCSRKGCRERMWQPSTAHLALGRTLCPSTPPFRRRAQVPAMANPSSRDGDVHLPRCSRTPDCMRRNANLGDTGHAHEPRSGLPMKLFSFAKKRSGFGRTRGAAMPEAVVVFPVLLIIFSASSPQESYIVRP